MLVLALQFSRSDEVRAEIRSLKTKEKTANEARCVGGTESLSTTLHGLERLPVHQQVCVVLRRTDVDEQ